MEQLRRHTRLAGLLVLIFFSRSITTITSTFPVIDLSKTVRQKSPDIESEVAHWSARLKSADEEVRREAVMMLSLIESDAAISEVASALGDRSPRVRAAAAAGLGQRGNESIVPLLAARLAADKDQFVRKTSAYALAKFHGSERTAALVTALRDKNPEVRGAAAVSLGDHADAGALGPLEAALSDKSAFVRAGAARGLGVNGTAASPFASNLIALLTSDEDNEVKRQAAAALGLIANRSALPALERAKRDKDPYLAQAASDAIRAIEKHK